MATTWQTVYDRSKRRYGYTPSEEDGLLTDALFLDRANELLTQMADQAGGFREEFTLNLPLGTASSLGAIALSSRVIRIVDGSVRLDYDQSGSFTSQPQQSYEEELRAYNYALEQYPAATPRFYFTLRGSAADAMLNLVLFPQSDKAVTNGIKLAARTWPAAIATGASPLPLQLGEERFLVPGICLALAETELSRGRRDAPVALWADRWERALTQYADVVEESLRGNRRHVRFVPDNFDYG